MKKPTPKKKQTTMIGAALALAVGGAVAVTQFAIADPSSGPTTPTPHPTASAQPSAAAGAKTQKAKTPHSGKPDKGTPSGKGSHGSWHVRGHWVHKIATELGKTPQQVADAFAKAGEANKPTDAEQTALKGMTPEQRQAWFEQRRTKVIADAAANLGVTPARLTAAIENAKAHPGPDQGKGESEAKLKAKLAQAVKDGTLTQAEADAVLKAYHKGVIKGR